MILQPHPELRLAVTSIGAEKAPLMVIDNFAADPDDLVSAACSRTFSANSGFYPGIRTEAPCEYQSFLLRALQEPIADTFGMDTRAANFSMCHYSIVTQPRHQLSLLQRIPHFDSLDGRGLASVHYLFHRNLGGTSFYRHRKTGYEYIDARRRVEYFRSLERENGGPNMPEASYINGDTPLFERVEQVDGVFNRLIIYRRNSLHSGSIDAAFEPDPSPTTGRLSINCFIDPVEI